MSPSQPAINKLLGFALFVVSVLGVVMIFRLGDVTESNKKLTDAYERSTDADAFLEGCRADYPG